MTNWIFISNPNKFRMDDWLRVNQFIEFVQNNNVQVNDIVYLYTTAPVQRIEYKLIVDKINIPYEYGIDDYDYSLEPESRERNKDKLLCRFRLIKKVEQPLLHLSKLREKGLRSSMQSPFKVSGALLDHIENCFK
jgi:5-methylcytosine-specific restriction protein A